MTGERDRARKREAATREILDLVSLSRDDAGPVFDAILHQATDLCNSPAAALVMGKAGDTHQRLAAQFGLSQSTVALYDRGGVPMNPDISQVAQSILTGKAIHIADILDSEGYRRGVEVFVSYFEETGARTELYVPLVAAEGGIGAFIIFRTELRPFSADEIALVETFAAQAVIAIENVRQFRELQTRLEREAATREILEVISQSRDDERPVFDVVLRKAADLCSASMADLEIISEDRSHSVMVAHWGEVLRHYVVGTTAWPMESELANALYMQEGRIVHVHDLADTDLYRSGDPMRVADVDKEGIRTFLAVPLFSGGRTIGCITLYRREVNPFSADDIALVETFAAQAVIAIENVRQFRELQERLAREAATREILEVISQSRDDERPVFDVIVTNAARLCDAPMAWLLLTDPAQREMVLAGYHGLTRRKIELGDTWELGAEADSMTGVERAIHKVRAIQEDDLARTEHYLNGSAHMRILVDDEGMRTRLSVPLVSGGKGIGAILLSRREVAAFGAGEIALVETFAAQAVIAIENVRQFKALEALNAELGDRVQDQVGEIERMGRLKRFLPPAVADAVVTSGSEKMLSSHRALLGVLFCDIRGFTAFCETAEPEETIEVLQTYHEEMGKLINTHGAGVDHRMGDGIMVLFNDPLPCDDPAGEAVRLAIAMRTRMAELGLQWKRLGHRLGFGVGISLGYATVGMVGFEGRFEYTASGTAVNLASRLCDEALDGEILLSPRASVAVEDRFPVESRGEITLKGIREPVEVFRLTPIVAA